MSVLGIEGKLKHQKLRNLTGLYIALKPIQVDSRMKLAIISD